MSEKTFQFTVVTPDKDLKEFQDIPVTAVNARGVEGEFTALPGHMPFLTDLDADDVNIVTPDGRRLRFFVSGGFVEVLPERVTILADTVEMETEIDEERASQDMAKYLKLREERRALKKAQDAAKAQEKADKGPLHAAADGRMDVRDLSEAEIDMKIRKAMGRVKFAQKRGRLPSK
ncbi:MAG: ATP synthase F1 subunit epsilon [Deltaproteobacteria bacterium]|jgi:F-type H+-transporting ATPase subunit epsilon|nr:ATP synthase F1 subunit epsilon [Deltaproteobacteria bacterium]